MVVDVLARFGKAFLRRDHRRLALQRHVGKWLMIGWRGIVLVACGCEGEIYLRLRERRFRESEEKDLLEESATIIDWETLLGLLNRPPFVVKSRV
jgi:hypothetical protein